MAKLRLLRLSELPLGMPARIKKNKLPVSIKTRLTELGLTEGTLITALLRSLGGNLTAYDIRGAVFALRRELTDEIEVQL